MEYESYTLSVLFFLRNTIYKDNINNIFDVLDDVLNCGLLLKVIITKIKLTENILSYERKKI